MLLQPPREPGQVVFSTLSEDPHPPEPTNAATEAVPDSLRTRAIRGGRYLVVREGCGIVVRLFGVVTVTRLIGPANYGIYASAAAFVAIATRLGQLGAEVFLISRPTEPTDDTYHLAFSMLLVTSTVVVSAAELLTLAVAPFVHSKAVLTALRVLLISVPINVLWAPAQAKLERRLAYRRLAWIETAGDVILYAFAVPLAFVSRSAWPLIYGYLAWQTWLLLSSALAAQYRPRWRWSGHEVRAMFRYGLTYSTSNSIDTVSGILNPVLVGIFFGEQGVGFVALAIRLVDTIGFALRSTWRMGLAVLSSVNDTTERLRRGVEEGMVLGAIVLGVPMAGFSLIAFWIFPLTFGKAWLPTLPLFGLLAFNRLITSVFLLQMAVLYARNKNLVVGLASCLNLALALAVTPVFLWAFGLRGYAYATLVGSTSFLLIDRQIRREISFSYIPTLPWLFAFGPELFAFELPGAEAPLLLLAVLTPIVVPISRRAAIRYAHEVARSIPLKRRARQR